MIRLATLVTVLAAVTAGLIPAASTVTRIIEDDGTTNDNSILSFTGAGDSDPNSLAILSTGSYVYFESQFDAITGADSIILIDPTQTGLARFTILADEAALGTAGGLAGNIGCHGIAVDPDTDDLYVELENTSAPDDFSIIRIPSLGLGTDTFGTAELFLDVGSRPNAGVALSQVDTTTTPNSLLYIDDDDVGTSDSTTNGIYRKDVDALAATPGTLVATFEQLAAGLTPVPTPVTDFIGFRTAVAIRSGANAGDIVAQNNLGTGHASEGDFVRWDPDTNTSTLFLEAPSLIRDPSVAMDNGDIAIWNVGEVNETDEAIRRYDSSGNLVGVIASDAQLTAEISNSVVGMQEFNIAFATNGDDVLAVFNGSNNESLLEITIQPTTPVEGWSLYR